MPRPPFYLTFSQPCSRFFGKSRATPIVHTRQAPRLDRPLRPLETKSHNWSVLRRRMCCSLPPPLKRSTRPFIPHWLAAWEVDVGSSQQLSNIQRSYSAP